MEVISSARLWAGGGRTSWTSPPPPGAVQRPQRRRVNAAKTAHRSTRRMPAQRGSARQFDRPDLSSTATHGARSTGSFEAGAVTSTRAISTPIDSGTNRLRRTGRANVLADVLMCFRRAPKLRQAPEVQAPWRTNAAATEISSIGPASAPPGASRYCHNPRQGELATRIAELGPSSRVGQIRARAPQAAPPGAAPEDRCGARRAGDVEPE